MLRFTVFVLSVYGIANALAVLKLNLYFFGTPERRKGLSRIPYLGDMFFCPACLSFWFGMAASIWFFSPAEAVCPVRWKAVLADGLIACAVSWILHALTMRLVHRIDDVKEGL